MPCTYKAKEEALKGVELELVPVEEVSDEIPLLVYNTLYLNWGVPYDPVEKWYDEAHGGHFLIARKDDGTLLGVCRLLPVMPETPTGIQIRQVVVTADSQGMGIGRLLMLEAEKIGRAEGASELFLWSRMPAYRFYESLGYIYTSEPWTSKLTGLQHRTMTKYL
ncbi:MAG: GNAT family N-acetyltransferase [Coriobacteriia bacterium]|nr:GNAT family N-acetyltransferase [Coriobacteriia bacterium]MCL2746112.1 GNAT family N-acetyltransferase [Coriobacteriia bacterium]MCL2870277.1 GNAT family N-acetyltransferase [Coriobacteriia bacterium]